MTTEPIVVRVTREFSQSAERVFDAFLDVDKARRFLFATAHGKMVRAELVPLVGGVFIFTDRRAGENVDHCGQYLTIERPRRLVFDFGIPAHDPERAEVAISIEPRDSGCVLVLTQALPARLAEYAERTQQGWTMILDNLASVLT